MRITKGHLAGFKGAVQEAVKFAKQHGPQLMVQTFIDEQQMLAYSFQLYRDSESVLVHWRQRLRRWIVVSWLSHVLQCKSKLGGSKRRMRLRASGLQNRTPAPRAEPSWAPASVHCRRGRDVARTAVDIGSV